ncbi:hypothetical protein V5T82_05530 [Magnetovibrio sp. PR-2]|uniref:hypothetical protein n=1 Tax=Magnetovibrio sp. PR-2 TaxID=3120356 RepID=UPI002FCE19F7
MSPDKFLEKAKPIADKARQLASKAKPLAEKARPFAQMTRPFADKAKPLAAKAKPFLEMPIFWAIGGACVAGGIFAYTYFGNALPEKPVADASTSYVLPRCDSEKVVSITTKIMREALEKNGHTISELELGKFTQLYGSVDDAYRFCEADMRFNGNELGLYIRMNWSDKTTRDLKIVANTNKRAVITVPEHGTLLQD